MTSKWWQKLLKASNAIIKMAIITFYYFINRWDEVCVAEWCFLAALHTFRSEHANMQKLCHNHKISIEAAAVAACLKIHQNGEKKKTEKNKSQRTLYTIKWKRQYERQEKERGKKTYKIIFPPQNLTDLFIVLVQNIPINDIRAALYLVAIQKLKITHTHARTPHRTLRSRLFDNNNIWQMMI